MECECLSIKTEYQNLLSMQRNKKERGHVKILKDSRSFWEKNISDVAGDYNEKTLDLCVGNINIDKKSTEKSSKYLLCVTLKRQNLW